MPLSQSNLNDARIGLMITGNALPFADLSALLSLTPTRTTRKGDLLNRLPEIKADCDEWVYSIPLSTPMGCDAALDDLLRLLNARKDDLQNLTKTYHVVLRMNVQSDYAHMTYDLHPETLRQLAGLGLGLEISSLSWGETGI